MPLLGGESAGERVELWLGVAAGTAVAAGEIRMPLHENTAAASIDLRVDPRHRRRGHGRRLLAHLEQRSQAAGRHRVFGQAAEPLTDGFIRAESPGRAFAISTGARPVLTEIRRTVDMSTLEAGGLAELRAAASQARGYTLLQWIDRAPGDLLEDLAVLIGRMSTDAPMEEMEWEPEAWTAARYRDEEKSTFARGRRRFATAARHLSTGRVVGYTGIVANPRQPEVAYQGATIVAPEHRGHRLGLLLKVANLELLRSGLAGVGVVNTWNAEANAYMIAVNDALGFRPVERWREWQLDLPM